MSAGGGGVRGRDFANYARGVKRMRACGGVAVWRACSCSVTAKQLFEGVHRMDNHQPPSASSGFTRSRRPYSTSVSVTADGGWVTVVELGVGATLTRLFDNEDDASAYGDEFAAWLAQRPVEWVRP